MKRIRDNPMMACMVVQQLDDANFAWLDKELATLEHARNGDLIPLMSVMVQRLTSGGISTTEVHGIMHDKDERKVWNAVNAEYEIAPKPSHIHILIRFPKGSKSTLAALSYALGVDEQFIEKPNRGKFAYDNMLAYLTHVKYSEKFQYPAEYVFSFTQNDPTRDYKAIHAERYEEWLIGRATVNKKKAALNIDMLEEMILTGQVMKEQIVLTDDLFNIYSHNARACEDALMVYGERRAYKTLQSLKQGKYKMAVFYITGQAGSGKTRMAKMFVDKLIKESEGYDEKWRVCHTAASNPMDDYRGEEILLMDDMRGSSLSASDWLKLLDPYNSSPTSARYKNKTPACRVIVITSTRDPLEFFYYCKALGGGDRSEAMDQFMRRIQCLTRVIKADSFEDATAVIGAGKQGDTYIARIPATNANSFSNEVSLTYHFEDGEEVPLAEAVDTLLNIVRDNNNINSVPLEVITDDTP